MVFSRKTAFVWSLSVIIFGLSATARDVSGLSTEQSSLDSSSLEEPSTTKTDEVLSGKSLQQNTDVCRSRADCRNGGGCMIGKDSFTYCECKNGTSGDICEVVDDCARNPTICGRGTDVQCGYDLWNQRAKCKCNNASKSFDSFFEKCRVPCTSDVDCDGVKCRKDRDKYLSFCRCPWGTRGDTCSEDVDECKENGLDCGNNPNVTCQEGLKGQAICYCEFGGWSLAFDYEAKDCIKCDCGGSNLGCRFFPNGTKLCYCDHQYYQEDGKCKACECGEYGTNGCQLENGTKRCNCWGSYLDNGGVCENCDCGNNHNGCTFKNGQKSCSCKPGYFQANGTCRRNCTASDVECKHGGKCLDSVCQCLPGTHGDVCEIIDGCESEWDQRIKCGYSESAYCDFNTTSLKMYCRCKNEDYLYDPYDRKCKACYCGLDGSCSFVDGRRKCDCKEGYAEKPGDWYNESECQPCSCGRRSIECTFTNSAIKKCRCEMGYSEKDGECSECDCGPDGVCSFDGFGRKVCDCKYHFKEKDGYCYECDCGSDSECEWNEEGEKTCNCKQGYGVDNGKCTYCLCWLKYYTLINCTFTNGIPKCLCPEGYQDEGSSCRDINECLNRSACPEKTTCKNEDGNYTCTCDNGYRPWSNQHDTKRYGCREVNECLENNACPYRDTSECVNTNGSYYCKCKEGYSSLLLQYSIERKGCEKDESGWKTGYIVLILLFIIAFIFLLNAIYRKRSSS